MRINKKMIAACFVSVCLSFCVGGIQADAAFVKKTEVKKVQEQKKKVAINVM